MVVVGVLVVVMVVVSRLQGPGPCVVGMVVVVGVVVVARWPVLWSRARAADISHYLCAWGGYGVVVATGADGLGNLVLQHGVVFLVS